MAKVMRHRRWDADTIRVTNRDLDVLTTIGDHRVVRQADLGGLLGRVSQSTVRGWLDRMTRGGFVHRSRIVGITWVQLTVAGGQAVGIPSDPRRFTTWTADHATATLRLRLHLVAEHPEAEWQPERYWRGQLKAMREVNRKAQLRVPDGSLHWPDGRVVAQEVELNRKHREDYGPLVRAYAKETSEVWWWCPPELVQWLHAVLAAALKPKKGIAGPEINEALDRPHRVYELPKGVRP